MEIWIIEDGEKSGPLHDFEIRRKIENGDLPSTTPAWHEGLDAWRPLSEIPLFAGEFEKESVVESIPAGNSGETPPLLPAQPHIIRRFWARWFDLYLYAGVWWFVMWAAGRDIGAILVNPWIILFHYVPWFVLETILLHRFGTTPGKWLLGIRVVNDNGSLLNLADTTRRSARVLFLGIGFGWDLLALICQILALFTTRRLGRPLWDHAGGHHLEVDPLNPLRITGYVIGLFLALQLQWIVVAPHAKEQMKKMFPEFSEQFEKNTLPHLPENRK